MILDSGNLTDTPDKLGIVTSLFAKMHYTAIGMGAYDWRMGDEFFKQTAKNKLTILDTSPGGKAGVQPFLIKQIDGVKVAVVSFGAPPIECSPADDLAVRKARFAAFMEARCGADVLILLDQAGVASADWIERNRARIGARISSSAGCQSPLRLDRPRSAARRSFPRATKARQSAWWISKSPPVTTQRLPRG